MRRNRALLLLDALLLAGTVWAGVELRRTWSAPVAPTPTRSTPAAGSGEAASPPVEVAVSRDPGPLAPFVVVAERNLFNPARSETIPDPPKPVPPATPPPQPRTPPAPPPPKPRLYGVVIGATGTVRAYLEDPKTRKVHGYAVGESVAESRLERIQPDRVVMRRGDDVFEVLLRDPTKPRPTAPRAVPGVPTPPATIGPGVESPPARRAGPLPATPPPGSPGAPGFGAQPGAPGIGPARPPVRPRVGVPGAAVPVTPGPVLTQPDDEESEQ